MRVRFAPSGSYLLALLLSSAVSTGLLLVGSAGTGDFGQLYLVWNLFLAWIPFGLMLLLVRRLRRKLWSSWEGLALTAAWLAFLPNSFYMISDFIHIQEVSPDRLVYGVVVFTAFIYTGVVLGFSSLYLAHQELRKRLGELEAAMLIGLTLLLCSSAIYVGRDLRWNTWDILVHPAGVLFDLSERLLHPSQYGQMLGVIVPFFVLLSSMYFLVWRGTRLLGSAMPDKSRGR